MGSHYPIALSGWDVAERYLDCDVVMAHTRFFMTTIQAANIAARRNKRICVVDHGSGPLRSSPRALSAASITYERAVTSYLKRRLARFFGVSSASVKWLEEFGIFGASLLPNGVAPLSAAPMRKLDSFNEPVVFYAGRLLPEKGVQELVEAVEVLVAQGARFDLRIGGDGPLATFLKARAISLDFFSFLGRLSSTEIEHELAGATVLVNPSNYAEGLPTILLEAGNAAMPVISTPRGGSADLIRNGHTGWLISEGSRPAITEGPAHGSCPASRGAEERFGSLFLDPTAVYVAYNSHALYFYLGSRSITCSYYDVKSAGHRSGMPVPSRLSGAA